MTRKTMLLAGVSIVAVVTAGIGGQQLYQGHALRALEAGLVQVRKDGIAGNAVAWAEQHDRQHDRRPALEPSHAFPFSS